MENVKEVLAGKFSIHVGNPPEKPTMLMMFQMLMMKVNVKLAEKKLKTIPLNSEIDLETDPLSRIGVKTEDEEYIFHMWDIRNLKKGGNNVGAKFEITLYEIV